MKLREEQPSIATASHHTQASLSTSIGTTAEHRDRNTPSPNGNKKMKFCHDRTDTALVALDRSLSLSTAQSRECGTDTESYRSTDCTKRDEGFKLTVQPLDDASESSTESLSCSALFQSFSIHQNEHSSTRVQSSFPCSSSTSSSPKRVSFTVVQVQEYALTLGDHPCADSYPLSLDWEHTAEKVLPLNDYERSRDALRRNSSPIFASHPGHLSAMQRRIRLSKVAGLQPAELTRQEQQRIQKLILDQAQEHLSDFDGDDCDEPFQETIDGIPSEMDDYIFQDDFDPIQVTRSTSLSELEIDCSLLEYLYDSDDEEAQAFQATQKFRRNRRHSAP